MRILERNRGFFGVPVRLTVKLLVGKVSENCCSLTFQEILPKRLG
jgi:hypothetical protein